MGGERRMKTRTVIAISSVAAAGFAVLVWYGLTHARGRPVPEQPPSAIVLPVRFIDREIDLEQGLSPEVWEDIAPVELDLVYQLTVLPWPKERVPSVSVRAFHNGRDIYFHLRWPDETEDAAERPGAFVDACAVMMPLGDDVMPSSVMMGFLGRANIWHWKAGQNRRVWSPEADAPPPDYADYHYPFEEEELFPVSKPDIVSAVDDLVSVRAGTVGPKPRQAVRGRGAWRDGHWEVVLARSLEAVDPEVDALFDRGSEGWCAFAVWNGSAGDRGGRKSMSGLVALHIE
jgi:hypothetical protein